jgi:peptidoglycan hydrolase-like protein with peptidoglycan-binding domain
MNARLIGRLRRQVIRPVVFFPLVAGLAVLAVYGVIELGLAMTGRWERDLMRRMEHHRQHQPNVLVTRYEERLRAVRTALKERGYPAGPSDAVMNSHTAEALRSFQRRQGLRVTGRPDPATAVALGLEQR